MERAGLVLSLDGASRRSTLKSTQVNNILPDPGNWSTGTGGQTGYSPNGSTSEQNRVSVTDDPWGRSSITWRTTPDSTSGADGGWNSSYYPIDRNYTYRYSMWVRRYTSGTGGRLYMGMNPNPIRNDNGNSQSNPYFSYPSIATLTQNQWYLVVAHVFYEGYTGGRHPESGWYENGVKISDKSYGNTGASDTRWASGTTSARHRAYHYYTTNVNSGIEFAYPRIDKIDGKEPSISEMVNRGESGWLDLSKDEIGQLENGLQYSLDGVQSSFDFDGTDDYINLGNSSLFDFGQNGTIEAVLKPTNSTGNNRLWCIDNNSTNLDAYLNSSGYNVYMHGGVVGTTTPLIQNKYNHLVVVYNAGTISIYINGNAGTMTGTTTGYNISNNSSNNSNLYLGAYRNLGYNLNGETSIFKIYNKALSADEVQQNYNAYKNRFNL